MRSESDAPAFVIDASVEVQDGSELSCWFHSVLNGLRRLVEAGALVVVLPRHIQTLRHVISTFFRSPRAVTAVVTSAYQGEPLPDYLQRFQSSLAQVSREALAHGKPEGQGGTEAAVAASILYEVDVFTYLRHGAKFKRVEHTSQRSPVQPSRGTINLLYTPPSSPVSLPPLRPPPVSDPD